MLGINPPGAGAAKGAGGAVHLSPSVQHHPRAPVSPRTRLVPLPGAQGAARTRLRKALCRGHDSAAIALGGLQLSQSLRN